MTAAEGLASSGTGTLVTELCLELGARRAEVLPPLLERFRGGTAVLSLPGGSQCSASVERWFLWICSLKSALDGLEGKVAGCGLPGEEKDKIIKDIKGMRGSLTTFNLLFRDKEDHFVGMKSEP